MSKTNLLPAQRLRMIDHHVNNPSQSARAYSNSPTTGQEQSLVLSKTDANLRILTLNRPQALNALNAEMIQTISNELVKWERSPEAKIIILKGIGRAFCAGGDVVSLIKSANSEDHEKQNMAVSFFRSEYELDSFIAKMSTPIVCFLDGISMGGGLGLSMHTPFRIATENTRVAMPETAIGLFPDVGASFFLSRLDGELGTYLGLTGTSLHGWGAFQAGIASHFVPARSLAALQDRLSALSPDITHDRINDIINEFSSDAIDASSSSPSYDLIGVKRQVIDHCFGHETVEEIINQLGAVQEGHLFNEDPLLKTWAKETKDLILARSPSSCKITLSALRQGKQLSIDQCFSMEMKLAATCCDVKRHPDFAKGVKHLLIDKQKTRADWEPNRLEDVDLQDVQQKYFSRPTTDAERLKFIETKIKSYKEYPYLNYSLPTEQIIKEFVIGNVKGTSGHFALTPAELIELVQSQWLHKVGVKEKVLDVLKRRTIQKGQNEGNVLKWQY